MMVEQQNDQRNSQVPTSRYVKDVPTLYERQFQMGMAGLMPKTNYGLWLTDSMIGAVTGFRGDGKSTTLSYIGMFAKSIGLRVWANYPVVFNIKRESGALEHHEVEQIDLKYLLAMPEDVQGGLILIDEYKDWGSRYTFNSMRNRLLNAFWGQIRKNTLSFFYSVKFIHQVDIDTREETDVEINCEDAYRTPDGGSKYKQGEQIYWHIHDYNRRLGYVPRSTPTFITPEYSYKFYARPIWGGFDTSKRFDVFEAMAKVELDLEKTVISNKGEKDYASMIDEETKKQLLNMFTGGERYPTADLYMTAGAMNRQEKEAVAYFLSQNGIGRDIKGGRSYFGRRKAHPQ